MKARDNPYRVERLHQLRFRFTAGDLGTLLRRFRELNQRGAIVGPHGAGKTTLVAELARELRAAGGEVLELRLNEANRPEHRQLVADVSREMTTERILILDGAEQLGSLRWRSFLRESRHFGGLLITAHAAGRLPTLYECRPGLELLRSLTAELAGEAAPGKLDLRQLYQRHGGNLRDCLRELYDTCRPDGPDRLGLK